MAKDNLESGFSITLTGDGISLSREIDRATAVRVLNVVLGDASMTSQDLSAARERAAPMSLREYLDEVEAVRKPDQILAIAHFICEHEGKGDFTREDVKARFSVAREPLPANFPRDFTWTVRNGWIAEVHGKDDRFYVTSKGQQAVAAKFSAQIKRATGSGRFVARRRRQALRSEEDRQE